MEIDKIVKGQAVKLRIDHLTGNLSEIECETFLNNFLKAINYTRCCKTLPCNYAEGYNAAIAKIKEEAKHIGKQ